MFKNFEDAGIQVIKLVSGESIICHAPKTKTTIQKIYCPMEIVEMASTDGDGEGVYVLSPWFHTPPTR
jgi:hypothetical protein